MLLLVELVTNLQWYPLKKRHSVYMYGMRWKEWQPQYQIKL